MSFTEDELQAFHSILEQRFIVHRQEMEQIIDQHIDSFQQNVQQQLVLMQQETVNYLKQVFSAENDKLKEHFTGQLGVQQDQITQDLNEHEEQEQQHIEVAMDRMLAAQLLGIEQLLSQQIPMHMSEQGALAKTMPSQIEGIEVQTDLPWEDLSEIIGDVLSERLVSLHDSIQRSVKNLEQYLSGRLQDLREEINRFQFHSQSFSGNQSNAASLEEVLGGIEQLGHIMESMQVAMSANHALLSNRLYHHQQLPLERAHPTGMAPATPLDRTHSLLAQAKERVANGLDPELPE